MSGAGAGRTAWRLALLGSAIVVVGFAAVLAASTDGMSVIPASAR